MARTLSIEPLAGTTFGAVVTGVKVTALDDATWRELYAAWLQYALLIFPDQHLKRDEQIAFAKRFGPLEFEMAAISNVKADGSLRIEADNDDVMKILKGNMLISVHTEDGKEVDKAKEIFKREGAQDISSTGEAAVKAA